MPRRSIDDKDRIEKIRTAIAESKVSDSAPIMFDRMPDVVVLLNDKNTVIGAFVIWERTVPEDCIFRCEAVIDGKLIRVNPLPKDGYSGLMVGRILSEMIEGERRKTKN